MRSLLLLLVLSISVLANNTVSVELYYESQCPYCRSFITGSLNTAVSDPGVFSSINLTMVPFGNARETKDASANFVYSCQHGAEECVGNLWAGCVTDQFPSPPVHFPVLYCMEQNGADFVSVVPSCLQKAGLESQGVVSCAASQHGIAVQHANAVKTKALNPPHQYVPWIVINGVHNDEIQSKAQDDLLSYVCSMLDQKPSGCASLLL